MAAATRPARSRSATIWAASACAAHQGQRHRSEDDRARRLPGPLPRRAAAAAGARGDERRRRWSPTSRTAWSIRQRGGPRSRRCCTPSCPRRHVDHAHADAICALTNHARPGARACGRRWATTWRSCRTSGPGFPLSKRVAELAEARAVVLDKHGLVTWGETHEQSYGDTSSWSARAPAYLDRAAAEPAMADARRPLGRRHRRLLRRCAGCSRAGRARRAPAVDPSQRALADRADVEHVATAPGQRPTTSCASVRSRPWSRDAAEVDEVVDRVRARLPRLLRAARRAAAGGLGDADPLPRVVLVPGLGASRRGPTRRRPG